MTDSTNSQAFNRQFTRRAADSQKAYKGTPPQPSRGPLISAVQCEQPHSVHNEGVFHHRQGPDGLTAYCTPLWPSRRARHNLLDGTLQTLSFWS